MAAQKQAINDQQIQDEVRERVGKDKAVGSPDLNVLVKDGIVTLTGRVETNAAKAAAGDDAIIIDGVRAVANDLEVRPAYRRDDTELARDVLRALKTNACVPADRIKAAIIEGRVTLEGEVHWEVQKMMAEAAVKRLHGITGVVNHISVKPLIEEIIAEQAIVAIAEDTSSFYENLGAVD
ncbi:MAG: BON domain-containing protein [Blastocatellia bacterium]